MVMARWTACLMVATVAIAGPAAAQPAAPPPAPMPAPAPADGPQDPYAVAPGADPILAEQIAQQLVGRAQELLDAKIWLDAKQLAVEALVESPKGGSAEHAKYIIKLVNQQLGIKEEAPPPPPKPPVADTTPFDDSTKHQDVPQQPEGGTRSPRTAATVHAAIAGGLLGATIGSLFDTDSPAKGAVPVGAVFALGAGWFVPKLFDRWHWDEAQVRTVGAGSVWGGVVGGLFADVVTGANGGDTSAPGILVGATIGSTLGVLGSSSLASDHKFTRGDVALVDTLAGIGTAGGLTLGMLMQPAQGEAYSLNAAIGATAGVIAGYVAAPQTNTTPGRMLRVAGVSAIGGAVPFLLYAAIHDSSTDSDERIVGALSTAGLVGGAWLGFYLTRNYEVGLDVPDGKPAEKDDAPPAVVGRSSDGHWGLGGLALSPLSPKLANHQQGMAVTVLGATF